MSPDVLAITLVRLAVAAATAQEPPCSPEAQALLQRGEEQVRAAEYDAAADALRQGYAAHGECADLVAAAWGWNGWLAAIGAARRGGTPEALQPVADALAALEPTGRTVATQAEYAAALVHAAAAASQHEREEMRVWLEHARDVAARIALVGGAAVWPLPHPLAEGELWLEVDDLEAARDSFSRALAAGETAAGLRGLARAQLRLGDTPAACASFRRASVLASDAFPAGVVVSETKVALPWCAP